jgi:hypothetical protein
MKIFILCIFIFGLVFAGDAFAFSDAWLKMHYFQKYGSSNVVDLVWEVRRDHSMVLTIPSANPQGLMNSTDANRCDSMGGKFVRGITPKDHDSLTLALSAAIREQESKQSQDRLPADFKLEVFEGGKLKTASVSDRNLPAVAAALLLIEKQYSLLFQSRAQVVELKVRQRHPLQIELLNVGKFSVVVPIPDQPAEAIRLMDQQGNRMEAHWLNRPRSDSVDLKPGQSLSLKLGVSAAEAKKISVIRYETLAIQRHLPRGQVSPVLSLCAKLK